MPRVNPGPPCKVCGKPSTAKNLCHTHYMRLRRSGTVDKSDWGSRRKHPLYNAWRETNRPRCKRSPEWDDFWVFVEDVGDKPSPEHMLSRLDDTKVFSKENWFWREWIGSLKEIGSSEYSKLMRKKHPLKEKNRELKKRSGINLEEYNLMLDKQEGVCDICKKPETMSPKSGGVACLAVDHCHSTSKIRGLLCSKCNLGLGHFNDDLNLLSGAMKYLSKHSE